MESELDKINLLKRRLNKELNKSDSDNNIVLKLSHDLARLDEKQVRFSVDANLINRLGKELVGRHETAVSELVKNAFDADALEVKLIFENAWKPGGILIIEDNGVGMNKEQLVNGFMRLSSSDKIHNPISERYKRIKAGRKGIGRFSTQRLGNKLTIITQTHDAENAYKVNIDWADFEMDKDLLLISNRIEIIPKTKEEGTTLIIENLRDPWSDTMIKRAYRYTSDLLQPFPLSEKRKVDLGQSIDPGFKSYYFRQYENKLEAIVDDEEAFFQHALAEIEGYILDDGQGCWSLKSDKLNFKEEVFLIGKERDDEKSKFVYVRDIHFKCYYFIYDAKLLPTKTLSFIKSVANETGGIRLYRNGFRVLPYGEKGNDWIGLDESTRRRAIIVPHQNISFFGFAEITDTEGLFFEETSSREGLIENDTFKELSEFIYKVITSAVLKIASLRKRKGTAGQKNWEKKGGKTPEEEIDEAIQELEDLVGSPSGEEKKDDNEDDEPEETQGKIKDVVDRLKEGREKEKEKVNELIEEINMLRILAGLGLVIGEFVHEVDRFLPAFDTDIRFLRKAVSGMKTALERADRLDENLKGFSTYTAYFYEAISRNVLRELTPIELRDAVHDFEEVITENIKKAGFVFHKPVFEDYDLWTTPMHRSEWAAILFNLYINSKKAIKRAGSKGEIFIKCGRENGLLFLEFSDNGDGIPPENVDKVFDAFFTTTSVSGRTSSDEEAMTGIGLGLKIVKDIIGSYGGEVLVANPETNFNTTIRIEIPENNSEND